MLREFATGVFIPYLGTLGRLLEKAAAHAKAATLPDARLAPDMYPLRRQVQIACHHARAGMIALTKGVALPTPDGAPDDDLAKLQALVKETIAFVEGVDDPVDGERIVRAELVANRVLEAPAARFLREWSFAHFFFHVVTAYDILRVAGVQLGKRDFVSHLADAITLR